MSSVHLSRSMLVTPGYKLDQFLSALGSEADLNLIDFEDGVSTDKKPLARRKLAELAAAHPDAAICIRMNSIRSPDGLRDLLAVLETRLDPQIIVLPKVESCGEVEVVDNILSETGRTSKLWAIIESARGLVNATAIAGASTRLVALSFGSADYAAEIGSTMDWDYMVHARSQVLLAAHSRGLCAIDSPTFNLSSLELLREECEKSKNMGFTGKVAIHPKQVPIINEIYTLSQSSIAWAKDVIAQFSEQRGGIFVVNGSMVGPPFLTRAKQILARVGGQ